MLAATSDEGYAACCEAIAGLDLEPDLALIAAPTLVLAGADDPAAPPEEARRIASCLPAAHLAVIDRSAHLANVEQPRAVGDAIAGHLAPILGELPS
jgi:pimeloyl-ACP methyl ester carboxylesterase